MMLQTSIAIKKLLQEHFPWPTAVASLLGENATTKEEDNDKN